jgi:hypothetical protein
MRPSISRFKSQLAFFGNAATAESTYTNKKEQTRVNRNTGVVKGHGEKLTGAANNFAMSACSCSLIAALGKAGCGSTCATPFSTSD